MKALCFTVFATLTILLMATAACSSGGGGNKDTTPDDAWADGMCQPDCEDKDCGGDGCGGSCGNCGAGAICNADDQCLSLPTCQVLSEVKCGDTLTGNTTGGDSLLQNYSCENYEGTSSEATYIFLANMDDTITFTLDSPGNQLDLLVTSKACDTSSCLAMGDTEIELQVKGSKKYYLVVDAQDDAVGPYSLTLSCLSGCQPDCTAKECGDDGCGGNCGKCPNAAPYCVQGTCEVECTPDCTAKECGDDGCGTPCGTCQAGTSCEQGECLPDECIPDCTGKQCGNNGCGGTCGQCTEPLTCSAGKCVEGGGAGCAPQETAGCGGCACEACVCEMDAFCCETQWDSLCADECAQCGFCGEEECGNGLCAGEENCTSCPQDCGCPAGTKCAAGECVCQPSCNGKQCGDDGCGGTCGACGAGKVCVDYECVDGTPGDGCTVSPTPGCGGCACEACVCSMDAYCCQSSWDDICVDECKTQCGGCGGSELGKFGDPCTKHGECESSVCALDWEFCTEFCLEDCPPGFTCLLWEDLPPDVFYVCLPECLPECTGKECGDDGCGGNCGDCLEYQECIVGKCHGEEPATCIHLTPEKISFGQVVVGELASMPLEIGSCGTLDLEIYGFEFEAGASENFGVDFSSLPHIPSLNKPVILEPNQTATVSIMYLPDKADPVSGGPLSESGLLKIQTNAQAGVSELNVSGVAVGATCPNPVITCQEGEEVIPLTTLHLSGTESTSSEGQITKYEWSVDQPAGSKSLFSPSATFPSPTFEVNVAGAYTFYLDVWDDTNIPSCQAAQYQVVVIPDKAIHIELLWTTPNDPDETDEGPEAGADLDLHFVHPSAGGPDLDGDGLPDGWFDGPFDCFWFNPNPNWGSLDPAAGDDPMLARDDTDGAGPEVLLLDIPEEVTYKVGTHYWNDQDYGHSLATIRIYIYAQLVFEKADVMLVNHDMWDVCRIDWPSGDVTLKTTGAGDLAITSTYQNPFFGN